MAKLLTFTVSLLMLASISADEIFQDMSYKDALKEAKQNQKILMIDFYTTWCGPCKKLDQITWKDPSVKKWLKKRAVSLKIDAEEKQELARKFKVRAYPTIIFLSNQGIEKGRIVGYCDAKAFLEEAKGIVLGEDPLTIAQEKLKKAGVDDPRNVMKYANTLMQMEMYEKALEKYLWCLDHGLEKKPSFYGVRASFLLSNIIRLGRHYPQALVELEKRYLKCREKILKQKAKKLDVFDFVRLAEKLKRIDEAVQFYEGLRSSEKFAKERSMLRKVLSKHLK